MSGCILESTEAELTNASPKPGDCTVSCCHKYSVMGKNGWSYRPQLLYSGGLEGLVIAHHNLESR